MPTQQKILYLVALLLSALTMLSACSTTHRIERDSKNVLGTENAAPRRGAYYQDDGPGSNPPPNLEQIADAVPRIEPLAKGGNKPYDIFGVRYVPELAEEPFRQRGIATWYGRKFHGQRTANGEIYDMYAMTGAHTTLPIPSYVRVTNISNGKTVVVRINDRGPFHSGRVIDLSYAAASKLGFATRGSTVVEIARILPTDIAQWHTDQNQTNVIPNAQTAKVAAENFYLQLGAFAVADNAAALRARIIEKIEPLSGLSAINHALLELEARDNVTRLWLGPYPTRAIANTMAERIYAALQLKAVIVSR